MKTIIVDHDTGTEIHKRGRFNNIIPLLKIYGCATNFFPPMNTTGSEIIIPEQLSQYLNSNCDIIYVLTSRIPDWNNPKIDNNDDSYWLDELTTEIPKDIVELANKGLLRIAFFIGELITLPIDQLRDVVNKQLAIAGINKEKITVYLPNFRVTKLGVSHIKFISIFEMSYYEYLNRCKLPLAVNVIQSVNLNRRNKKFTFLNHLNKSHRLCIAASLYNTGRHLDGYFSYLGQELVDGHPYRTLEHLHKETFLKLLPFKLDTDKESIANDHFRVVKPFFNDAYWNFVTESFFADTYGLTEKTFKPIVNLQPFILFGAPKSLAELHRLGYETFHSIIDESYDLEENHDIRMGMLIKLAFRLVDIDHDEQISMMTKIKPILEHNQKVFFNKNWREML